jgi:hypothetical protein
MQEAIGWFPAAKQRFSFDLPPTFDPSPMLTSRHGGALRCSEFCFDTPARAASIRRRPLMQSRLIAGNRVERLSDSSEEHMLLWDTGSFVAWTQVSADDPDNIAFLTEGVRIGPRDSYLIDWSGVANAQSPRMGIGDRCTFGAYKASNAVGDIALTSGSAWMDSRRSGINDRYCEHSARITGSIAVLVTGQADAFEEVAATVDSVVTSFRLL